MIKVNFISTIDNDVNIEYDYFVPFTVKIGSQNYLPETIYVRNLDNENFVELRFDAKSKKLYEITVVGIDFVNIIKTKKIEVSHSSPTYYNCLISENKECLFSNSTKVYSDIDSLKIEWKKENNINYYNISEKFILGSNSDGELSCVIIKNIDSEILDSFII